MTLWQLAKRSLIFYWRTNLGVLLAAAVSTAVLTGALLVGDCVHHTLQMMLKARLGRIELALLAGDRFFRDALADDIAVRLNVDVAPVLRLGGLISNSDGTKRANKIEVLGINQKLYDVAAAENPLAQTADPAIVINEQLAEQLDVKAGDEVVLRVEKPQLMPPEAPLTPDSDRTVAFRLPVERVAGPRELGRFGLGANQLPPMNVFVRLGWLQSAIEQQGHANMLLTAAAADDGLTAEQANKTLADSVRLADLGLQVRKLDQLGMLELRSTRAFIDQHLADVAASAAECSVGILTYFVNEFRLADRTTPYSVVSALGPSTAYGEIVPGDMGDDEIVINEWLAEDLEVKAGDSLELEYFVVGLGRGLRQARSTLRVRKIVPMEGLAADRHLLPDFPGLADVDNCRDWRPGIPVDLDKIRRKDEDYWNKHRGTPKAFVTLSTGQKMWANRYGNLTAVRYPADEVEPQELAARILGDVNPASIGLSFQPVQQRGARASSGATDFGHLFVGFSFFLIVSAVLLTGLLFVFSVESRSEQLGMLLAVGLSPKLVRRLLLIEGTLVAASGVLVGTAASILYTKAMIYALATIWQTALSSATIRFDARPATLLTGALTGLIVSVGAIFFTSRKQLAKPAQALLAGNIDRQFATSIRPGHSRTNFVAATIAAVAAIALVVWPKSDDSATAIITFFGAGALLLLATLTFQKALLTAAGTRLAKPMRSRAGLGLRNAARRTGRSLAVIALFACGIFMVVAVGANRRNPLAHAARRDSGTGGFTLFGESSIGILHDFNSESGRRSLGLSGEWLREVQVVQFRVRDGDDASCFNLNRAQKPRVLGVSPRRLHQRRAFSFADAITATKDNDGWLLLEQAFGENVVPAVGDYATVVWGLGKAVGDRVPYTDERGRTFDLLIVGMISSSVLQGSLVIAEDAFVERFSSEAGYRLFLVDTLPDKAKTTADRLSFELRDLGLELTPAPMRLAAFSKVESMYLSIFQLVGGLGLILGTIGLGVVVLRNVLERRAELAMLRAVGFDKSALKHMVMCEHAGLLVAGLICGIVSALVAVAPALQTPAHEMPYVSLPLTIVAVTASGLLWVWVAAVVALRPKLLDALRTE